jgi:DNA-directed RNA polymerase alpha subunit
LHRSGIATVGQLLVMSADELLGVRNFGLKALQELRTAVIEWADPPEYWSVARPEGEP